MVNRVVIALGSNIDKETNMPRAIELLSSSSVGQVTAVSPIYETVPMGLEDQPNFFNAALLLETEQTAAELKDGLIRQVETMLKRVRQADPNAPRTIDADIILFNDAVMEYTTENGRSRHIPDKDLLRFAHVAVPVADLLPHMPHPETGEPLRAIADRLFAEAATDEIVPLWRRDDLSITGKASD